MGKMLDTTGTLDNNIFIRLCVFK